MRPTFMGFEMATRSLSAIQKAQDIMGNNIGNIGVTGYTRQRVDMVSVATNNRYTRYAQKGAALAGQGSLAYGVSQVRDPFLDKRFREEYTDVGYYNKLKEVLTDLDDGLVEINPSTMTSALSKLETAWNELLKSTGSDSVGASSALAASRTLTQVFQQMSKKVDDVWNQQKYDLSINVNSANSILERIASLNDAIKKEVFSSAKPGNEAYGPNELLDQRNVLLDQLSEYGDFTYKTNGDGTVDVKMGRMDHPVVTGTQFDQIILSKGGSDQTVALKWQSTGEEIAVQSGSFLASLDMLNGRGPGGASTALGEGFEKGILYYKDKIDIFAQTVAREFNTAIPVYNPDGTIKGYKEMFQFDGDQTAANLVVNPDWANDATYITKDVQKPGEGEDKNAFAANVKALFTKSMDFGEFQGTMGEYISFYTNSNLGNQAEFAGTRLTAVSDVADNLMNKISEISGVSMEEEGVDMMQFQKAFQAMGRVMTAFDEMLDVLINKTGLVGR